MSTSDDPERDARLLAELDEPTARMLFPERFQRTLEVTLVHPPLHGEAAETCARLAGDGLATGVAENRPGRPEVVRATFPMSRVEDLHAYYAELEGQLPASEVEVLISGNDVPMVRELWLPLLWLLRS